jgi:hypothetical protein
MPRSWVAVVPAHRPHESEFRPGEFVESQPGSALWEVASRDEEEDGVHLRLLPLDAHDLPPGQPVRQLGRPLRVRG